MSVPISSLPPLALFRYATRDSMASGPVHRLLGLTERSAEIQPFCDRAMVSWIDKATRVIEVKEKESRP